MISAVIFALAHRVGSRGQCYVAQRKSGAHELFTKVIKLSATAHRAPRTIQLVKSTLLGNRAIDSKLEDFFFFKQAFIIKRGRT